MPALSIPKESIAELKLLMKGYTSQVYDDIVELAGLLDDPVLNFTHIYDLLKKFDETVDEFYSYSELQDNPVYFAIFEQAEGIIETFRHSPGYDALKRQQFLKYEIEDAAEKLANHIVVNDIQNKTERIRKMAEAYLVEKVTKSETSFLERLFFNKKTTKTPDEIYDMNDNYEMVGEALDYVEYRFTDVTTTLDEKRENVEHLENISYFWKKHEFKSQKIKDWLTALRDYIATYDYYGSKDVALKMLRADVEKSVAHYMEIFSKMPLGKYVLKKRELDEKTKYFKASPEHDLKMDEKLKQLQESLDVLAKDISEEDILNVASFDLPEKNNFELLTMLLPHKEYHKFVREMQHYFHEELDKELLPSDETPTSQKPSPAKENPEPSSITLGIYQK
jgi:hypothetical protein